MKSVLQIILLAFILTSCKEDKKNVESTAEVKIETKDSIQQEKIELLESIIKSLTGRGFNIKAAIEWEKFKVGI